MSPETPYILGIIAILALVVIFAELPASRPYTAGGILALSTWIVLRRFTSRKRGR